MLAALRASAIKSSPTGLGLEPKAVDSEATEVAEASAVAAASEAAEASIIGA